MHAIVPFLSVLAVGFGCYITLCAAVPKFRVRAISRDPVSVLLPVSVFSIGLGLAGFGVAPRYTKLTAFVAFGTGCIAAILQRENRELLKAMTKTRTGKLLLFPLVIIGAVVALFRR
jgi:hypothetical protein